MSYKPGTSYIVTDKDCETAFAQCRACNFVQDNKKYRDVVDGTYLTIRDDDDINAYCGGITDAFRNYLKRYWGQVDWDEYTHILTVTTGMLRWVTMVAHVCEYIDRKGKIGEARKMLAWSADRLTEFKAGSDFVQRFLNEFSIHCDGRREEVVRMYGVAILVALMGHELGHACLGHVMVDADAEDQNSISRNNERSADLFASSVAQSIGNGYTGAVGAVVLDASFVWMTGKYASRPSTNKNNRFTTHPVSIDRVKMFIDSFNVLLEHSPVTAKQLMKLVNKGK